MSQAKLIIIGFIVVIIGIILLQNAEETSLKILFWNIRMSRIFFFPFLFLSGCVVGYVAAKLTGAGKRKEDR